MTRRTMTKPCLTMDLGAGCREWVVVGGFQESGKLLASHGNGEEGSPVGWTGKGWRGDAADSTSLRAWLWLILQQGSACIRALASISLTALKATTMYVHISDKKFLRGKFTIWLPCKSSWDAALLHLPSPNPSFLCWKFTWLCSRTSPYCLLKYRSTSQKQIIGLVQMGILTWLSLTVTSPHLELAYHRLDATDEQHSDHDYDLSILVWSFFCSSVDSRSWNDRLFHWIVCKIFHCDGFIYLATYFQKANSSQQLKR